jgi:hypothetical protein
MNSNCFTYMTCLESFRYSVIQHIQIQKEPKRATLLLINTVYTVTKTSVY